MAEYIVREALIERLQENFNNRCKADSLCKYVIDKIKTFPAAEVEPVQQGQWEGSADGYANGVLVYDMWRCSECGFDADGAEEKPEWKFCPNCGARMGG